jgi:hypothetical protein
MQSFKNKFFHKFVLLLLLVLLGTGCEKEDEYEDIPLENLKCPCEHALSSNKKIAVENVLLFDAKKTSWYEMKTKTFNGERSEFFSYSEESKSMIFYSIVNEGFSSLGGISICYVCNIPEEISEITITSTGLLISFSGDVFEACYMHSSIGFSQTNTGIILTSFKRKIK